MIKLGKYLLGIFGLLLIAICIFIGGFMGDKAEAVGLINIRLNKDELKYFGLTGVHVYAVSPKETTSGLNIQLDHKNDAIDLYKLYNDIAIFLSNNIDLKPFEHDLKTYGVYGNPEHIELIRHTNLNTAEYEIVGYLNSEDVGQFAAYLNKHNLGHPDGVVTYFNALSDEVKEELEMLLDERVVWELGLYLRDMSKFYNNCVSNQKEVVIIVNP